MVPEFLANKRHISDDECDDCNKQFSRYGDSLANYLGIVRTIQSVKGKKVPKFKSAGKNMHAESMKEDDTTNVIKIRRYDGLDSTLNVKAIASETYYLVFHWRFGLDILSASRLRCLSVENGTLCAMKS